LTARGAASNNQAMSRRAVDATAEEIAKEKAEALGLAGRALETALRELRDYDARREPTSDDPRRAALLARAAERTRNPLESLADASRQ
jgi:hypothetical protein